MIGIINKKRSDVELVRGAILCVVFAIPAYAGIKSWAIPAMTLAACFLIYIEYRDLLRKRLTKTQAIFSFTGAIFGTGLFEFVSDATIEEGQFL